MNLLFIIISIFVFSNSSEAKEFWCKDIFIHSDSLKANQNITQVSFFELLNIMKQDPYDLDNLPVIPLQMFKPVVNSTRKKFFVAERSLEILNDRRDFRIHGANKPIHPMGIGLTGYIKMEGSPWSGIFRNKQDYLLMARASLSQGNPYRETNNPKNPYQKRSTAFAFKIFPTLDENEPIETLNAVFQNDLNGLLSVNKEAIYFLNSEQTNEPAFNPFKVTESYEALTLLGVALGSFKTPQDKRSKFPFINPQIRPPHSLAEWHVNNIDDIKTPTWIKIVPRLTNHPVEESDFRLEILKTLERDGEIVYDLFASDKIDDKFKIYWEKVGSVIFNKAYLSKGVDQNILFPHDKLNSTKSKKKFMFPKPQKQYRSVLEDIQ